MNFQELAAKLKNIEEGSDAPVEECGEMPVAVMHSEPPKQQDNVTMNVSMNGQGPNGIKDLMSILRNIENGGNVDAEPEMHDEPLIGSAEPMSAGPEMVADETMGDDGESFANAVKGASGHHVHGIDAVTFSGDDMNSKGKVSPHARAPGTNALRHHGNHQHISEGLVERLSNLYEEVKTRKLNEGCLEDPQKHVLAHILATHKHDHKQLQTTGQAPHELYEKLYDYYWDDMPYGIKKHPDHQVRHDHVVGRCKQDMMTPECQMAMSQYAPKPAMAMTPAPMHEDQDIEFEEAHDPNNASDHYEDEEKKIRHLMRKYGWSRQEALEYFHYEKHDPKDYEDIEEDQMAKGGFYNPANDAPAPQGQNPEAPMKGSQASMDNLKAAMAAGPQGTVRPNSLASTNPALAQKYPPGTLENDSAKQLWLNAMMAGKIPKDAPFIPGDWGGKNNPLQQNYTDNPNVRESEDLTAMLKIAGLR